MGSKFGPYVNTHKTKLGVSSMYNNNNVEVMEMSMALEAKIMDILENVTMLSKTYKMQMIAMAIENERISTETLSNIKRIKRNLNNWNIE